MLERESSNTDLYEEKLRDYKVIKRRDQDFRLF